MKKYVCPVTEIITISTEAVMDFGFNSNEEGKPGQQFGNTNTFEEDVSAEYDNNKSLWDD